jgi:hypothetical protein
MVTLWAGKLLQRAELTTGEDAGGVARRVSVTSGR